MHQLMTNYPACLDVVDDVDYAQLAEPLFKLAREFEQVVLNATTLCDYYISFVPYTATVLARQILDQFILHFPEEQREGMTKIAANFVPYPLSYDPEELPNEFGSRAWSCSIDIVEGKKNIRGTLPIQRPGMVAVVRTIAMEIPERVPEGKQCQLLLITSSGTYHTMARFTHKGPQLFQDLEFRVSYGEMVWFRGNLDSCRRLWLGGNYE